MFDLRLLYSSDLVALTIYGESRGEPLEGQVAVGNVIRNRANGEDDYKSVVLKPLQFSCWNKNDPNYTTLMRYAEILYEEGIKALTHDIVFIRCYTIALLIISNLIIDNTNGAYNYMTNTLFNSSKRPIWARIPKEDPIVIGEHSFFNV